MHVHSRLACFSRCTEIASVKPLCRLVPTHKRQRACSATAVAAGRTLSICHSSLNPAVEAPVLIKDMVVPMEEDSSGLDAKHDGKEKGVGTKS